MTTAYAVVRRYVHRRMRNQRLRRMVARRSCPAFLRDFRGEGLQRCPGLFEAVGLERPTAERAPVDTYPRAKLGLQRRLALTQNERAGPGRRGSFGVCVPHLDAHGHGNSTLGGATRLSCLVPRCSALSHTRRASGPTQAGARGRQPLQPDMPWRPPSYGYCPIRAFAARGTPSRAPPATPQLNAT
jgi:hypothetical protein